MRGTDEFNRPETEIESDSEAHNLDHLTHGIMSKAKLNSKKIRDRPNYSFKQKKVGFKFNQEDNNQSPDQGKSSANESSQLSRPSLLDNTTFRDRSAFDDSSSYASRHAGLDLGTAFKSKLDMKSPTKGIVSGVGNYQGIQMDEYQFNNMTPNQSDSNDSKVID